MGETHKSVFDLPKNYTNISTLLKDAVLNDFNSIGLSLNNLFINSITLPTEVQKSIDTKTGMSAIGNLDEYLKFQMGKSIENASENPSGNAGAGIGIGAGVGMGMMFPQMIQNALENKTSNKKSKEEIFELINKLKDLLDKGAVTQQEFDETKKSLLLKL